MKKYLVFIILLMTLAPMAMAANYSGKTIAVVPFVNTSANHSLDYLSDAVAKMLVTDLKQSAKLTLVTRDNLDKILAENKLSRSELADPKNAQKLGKILGADLIVAGSIISAGGELRFDTHVLDVSTGEIVSGQKITGKGENEVIAMVDQLSIGVIRDLTGEQINIANTGPVKGNQNPTYQGEALTFWALLGNTYGMVGETNTAQLELKFAGGNKLPPSLTERAPLNICLVIDRSGSMGEEGKLDQVKVAAKHLIDQLTARDYISIVAYDTEVKVVQPPTKVENKDTLKEMVNELYPGDMTNLSGGLQKGYDLIKQKYNKKALNRVILLSDGLANVGITNLEELTAIVKRLREKGIVTTSFGVGNDYDAKLLTAMATTGAGNYYYIDRSERIPGFFALELAGMTTAVAKDIEVEIELAPGVQMNKVYGYSADSSGNRWRIPVGDIATGEVRSIFVELRLPTVTAEVTQPVVNVTLACNDAIDKTAITANTTLAMHFVPNRDLVAKNENTEVKSTATRVTNSTVLGEAQGMIQQGKAKDAAVMLRKKAEETREAAVVSRSQELIDQSRNLDDLANQVEAAAETPADSEDSKAATQAAGAAEMKAAYH